ncbi:MAG: hypothetical protein AB7I33_07045 [Gemmatimonadales bacterium]
MRSPAALALLLAAGPCLAQAPAACTDSVHRQFDFWVGRWIVSNPAGVRLGTNEVTVELNGCVVQESWTAAGGDRGRSLNAPDPDGRWHQTWVAERLGHLRMSGGMAGDTMVLEGRRVEQGSGIEYRDAFRWIASGRDTVRQLGLLEVPARDVTSRFQGVYVRSDTLPGFARPPGGACADTSRSAASRRLDFWVGTWRVEGEDGGGMSTVTTDLGGCLFEERYRGTGGVSAIAWTYYDVLEGSWYRTYADDRGAWRQFRGDLDDGVLVLRATDDSVTRLRVAPRGGGIAMVSEHSTDGGISWRIVGEQRYIPTRKAGRLD